VQSRKQSNDTPPTYDCFINCPFDEDYVPLFQAIVFTLIYCQFRPRCALELDNGVDVRISKIKKIISECGYGVHDISRTELDPSTNLPRFNMPLELGPFLGAQHYGGDDQTSKYCLIFDRTPHRFQKFISDIAGQDIRAHDNTISTLIRQLRNWLRTCRKDIKIPGDLHIDEHYKQFRRQLPKITESMGVSESMLEFNDFTDIVQIWIDEKVRGTVSK
jgi:hypothetical protein